MAEPPDLETLARRYLDLWQDQVSAMAADPELAETLGRLFQVMATMGPAGWAELWASASQPLRPDGVATASDDENDQPQTSGKRATRAATPNGATPAAAASGERDDDMARLRRRVAVLENRLAALEQTGGRKRRRSARV